MMSIIIFGKVPVLAKGMGQPVDTLGITQWIPSILVLAGYGFRPAIFQSRYWIPPGTVGCNKF